MWKIEAGDLDEQTIGHRLTIKDFQPLGIVGHLGWNNIQLKLSTWAQDYDVLADIFLANVYLTKYRIGLNSMVWFNEQAASQPSIYALPYFAIPFGKLEIYGETGLKAPGNEERMASNPHAYPNWTWAALAGIKYTVDFLGWKLQANQEISS